MRVEVTPRRAVVVPGQPSVFMVQVFNTEQLISGHHIRVLGTDSEWSTLDRNELSLFPGTTAVAVLGVNFPKGSPAGARRVSVEVMELTEPFGSVVVDLDLEVPAAPALSVKLDPVSVTAGGRTSMTAIVNNTGNVGQNVEVVGEDDEAQVHFTFAPPRMLMQPGESRAVSVGLKARRPLTGSPKVRPFSVKVNGDADKMAEDGSSGLPVQAFGSFIQKAWLSRGHIALIGLLLAATVFAAVLALTLARINSQSDNNSQAVMQALQASLASESGAGTGSAAVSGRVTEAADPAQGAHGVTVDIYSASDTTTPLASTATSDKGDYAFSGLSPGSYDLQFNGAGFAAQWYLNSPTAAGANQVVLVAEQYLTNVDVSLGGLPALISGTVVGPSPAGAAVSLEAVSSNPACAATGAATSEIPSCQLNGAVVGSTTTDGSGDFVLANVPSPANYELVVTKPGYAPASQQVNVSSGESDTGVTLSLQLGDGSITGKISSPKGALSAATVSATGGTGTNSVASSTVSQSTRGHKGQFVLRNLPTPGDFTLVVSAVGYASQTLSISLAAGQQLSGVNVIMSESSGDVSGNVSLASGRPAGGVTVAVSNGELSISTTTLTETTHKHRAGSYEVQGLPVPGTYEVTFSRPDLVSETREVELLAPGAPSLPVPGAVTDPNHLDVTLDVATASIEGFVRDNFGRPLPGIQVGLTSGTTSYTVTSANLPIAGEYEIADVVPGTYTISFSRPGALPTSSVVTLTAGEVKRFDASLAEAASIDGYVDQLVNGAARPLRGATVALYLAAQYPLTVLATTTTDSAGYYRFSDLDAPEQYLAQYAYPPGTPGQKTLERTVAPSEAAHLPTVVLSTATVATTTTTAPKPTTTVPPTTLRPTTLPPTTLAPTTLPPTTLRPTTLPPTTVTPNVRPTTSRPTTTLPTTTRSTTRPPVTTRPTTTTLPVTTTSSTSATATTSSTSTSSTTTSSTTTSSTTSTTVTTVPTTPPTQPPPTEPLPTEPPPTEPTSEPPPPTSTTLPTSTTPASTTTSTSTTVPSASTTLPEG